MALVQKQEEIDETTKLEAVDEKSEVNSQKDDHDDPKERNEDEDDEEDERKEENEDADDEADPEENSCCLKIPIYLSIEKEEVQQQEEEKEEVSNVDAKNAVVDLLSMLFTQGNTQNINQTSTNVKDDISEREIDIVKLPRLPTPPQEPGKTKPPPPRQSPKHGHSHSPCCGYMDTLCPRPPLGGYQGIGHSGFFPFAMPSLGFPVLMAPVFSPIGLYSSTMPQICYAQGLGYKGMFSYPNICCNNELKNLSHMHHCPIEEKHLNHYHGNHHHDDHHHSDHGHHHHHHGEYQRCYSDHSDDDHRLHHHHQSSLDDHERECQELEKCCTEHDADANDGDNNEDETKSVEDLLEEYLEDIDEKTERIHELLDECEAMDLFINVHGFELEEIHVTTCGRTVTVKGDHQYSEATWVRVRNFSEGYEIPEEFDISRTTATKTGDTVRIRIPHVDGE